MSYGVGRRQGLDPLMLWLWHRLVATALIGPLAWEPRYAVSVALKRKKRPKKKKEKRKRKRKMELGESGSLTSDYTKKLL